MGLLQAALVKLNHLRTGCQNLTPKCEELVELGNPNTCAEVKLCLFLFMSGLEYYCEIPKTYIADLEIIKRQKD